MTPFSLPSRLRENTRHVLVIYADSRYSLIVAQITLAAVHLSLHSAALMLLHPHSRVFFCTFAISSPAACISSREARIARRKFPPRSFDIVKSLRFENAVSSLSPLSRNCPYRVRWTRCRRRVVSVGAPRRYPLPSSALLQFRARGVSCAAEGDSCFVRDRREISSPSRKGPCLNERVFYCGRVYRQSEAKRGGKRVEKESTGRRRRRRRRRRESPARGGEAGGKSGGARRFIRTKFYFYSRRENGRAAVNTGSPALMELQARFICAPTFPREEEFARRTEEGATTGPSFARLRVCVIFA